MWKTTEIAAATQEAIAKGLAAGEAARIKAGIEAVISGVKSTLGIEKLGGAALESIIDANTYTKSSLISGYIEAEYIGSGCRSFFPFSGTQKPICTLVNERIFAPKAGIGVDPIKFIKTTVKTVVSDANGVANAAAEIAEATEKAKAIKTSTDAIEAASMQLYTTIAYSILAILIIVLIMVIIYLLVSPHFHCSS
ncbi:hypothetical protein C923_02115 [Plasmodium falciparum UGT5.1]|uniref:Surface antigen n=1 Tax=Plasmodium falciparum UGT5.1 TaxID=1237627 RepID=W7JQM0_PLAFA|nr:hypothetical protein C923_02115 [Plasmodium falciparum UGT5.1]